MSTRATYSFRPKNELISKTTTVYIHHDGYFEGAAIYFWNAFQGGKGCMATKFIRANNEAELTDSHDAHGDTDYKYSLTGSGPKAYLAVLGEKQFVGELHQFISANRKLIDEQYPELTGRPLFATVNLPYSRSLVMCVCGAKEYVDSALRHLNGWIGRFEGSANWNGQVDQLKACIGAFPELQTEETQKFI
jgi:hypothetical protein